MRRALFWGSVAVAGYTYVGFPILLAARAALNPKPWRRAPVEPSVTMIVIAYNEAVSIRLKIENILGLEYPSDRLEVIIASDGSDDGTDDIVAGYEPRVQLIRLTRNGKAFALNAAIRAATGEILVFSDANSRFAPNAIRALVRNFADPDVGGVAGDQQYERQANSSNQGEMAYWHLDRVLKTLESRAGNVISATGAIYAVRASLAREVPADVTDDFYQSVGVIASGRRLVFEREAVAYEPTKESHDVEFGRKVRIITRGLTGVVRHRALLDPRRSGFYAVQLLTHKVLRRVAIVPLALAGVSAASLWPRHPLYRLVTLGQGAAFGLGVAGLLLRRTAAGRHRVLAFPAFFLMANAAAMRAAYNVVRGRSISRWDPGRGAPTGGRGIPRSRVDERDDSTEA